MAGELELESPAQLVSDGAGGAPATDRAVVALGTWMAMLGAVRLVCEAADYAGACGAAMSSGLIAGRGWSWFLLENSPAFVVLGAWPLVLGLALRRTGWRDLARAGALTLLVLSVGGLLTAVADWSQHSAHRIAIGSFRVPRSDWNRLTTVGIAMGIAGATQLLVELATAAWALVLASRHDGEGLLTGPSAVRRSRSSRLALYVSVAFLVLTIRLPAWSAYLELISQSPWIRELILKDDLARMRSTRRAPAPESGWAAQVRMMLDAGRRASLERDFAESSEHYAQLVALVNTIPPSTMSPPERRLAAEALNEWAWLLATCPEAALRNHADSAKYARRALELNPNEYRIWNTLGVAYFRLGDWDDALSALYRSMELHDEGDSWDWFFLAMIHERLGHKERAREWFDKAVHFSRRYYPDDEELYRFEVEASEALGLPKPERLPPARPRLGPYPFGPNTPSRRRGRAGQRVGANQKSADAPGPRDGGRAMGPRSVL